MTRIDAPMYPIGHRFQWVDPDTGLFRTATVIYSEWADGTYWYTAEEDSGEYRTFRDTWREEDIPHT